MCDSIIINRGEVEIQTPRQFKNHFGFMPIIYEDSISEEEMDWCLCSCDLEKTFNTHKIPFKYGCGDYYVGELDLLPDF